MTMNANDLTKQFNRDVDAFWASYALFTARTDCLGARGKLLDTVDEVLLTRDAMVGADIPAKIWDDITRDIADIGTCLNKNGIAINGQPTQTSTGRMTYRIIAKPRFDA